MLIRKSYSQLLLLSLTLTLLFSGCSIFAPKVKEQTAKVLKTENATQEQLISEVNRLAKVNSLRAKMDLKFEDNSFAEQGIAEKYKTADGEVVVQRPANISLKVQVPVIKYDVAQMTSDGTKFRVAILNDGGSGKYKKFVIGTNNADYAKLQQDLSVMEFENGKKLKENVNAFANLRPQHFTDAMLVRPVDTEQFSYLQSTFYQEESDSAQNKKSPVKLVVRGYYFLDEFRKNADGGLTISRRFWFDRVGGVRLARQQIFDAKGEIESDITYGQEGNLGNDPAFARLPLRIEVTRPKDKYKMSLTYQTPESVTIGKTYPLTAFVLQNTWNLPEVDLDRQLTQVNAIQTVNNSNTAK